MDTEMWKTVAVISHVKRSLFEILDVIECEISVGQSRDWKQALLLGSWQVCVCVCVCVCRVSCGRAGLYTHKNVTISFLNIIYSYNIINRCE